MIAIMLCLGCMVLIYGIGMASDTIAERKIDKINQDYFNDLAKIHEKMEENIARDIKFYKDKQEKLYKDTLKKLNKRKDL